MDNEDRSDNVSEIPYTNLFHTEMEISSGNDKIVTIRARKPLRHRGLRVLASSFDSKMIALSNLLLSRKLDSYLRQLDEQAENMFLRLVKQLAEKEGVTEQLKAADQMAWVSNMNNIHARATEIVNHELIYA